MTAAAVLVDGVARDAVAATDRGLAYGDGVFRTLRMRAGRALNWEWHYRRLAADCAALGIEAPAEALLAAELARVAPADAVAKVIVTRGPAARGYAPPREAAPTRIVMAFAPPEAPAARSREGVRVRRCDLTLAEQPRFAGAKTLNRLENVLARAEWDDPEVAEGLLGDARGRVIGGTMSNLFVVEGGRVATPELTRCGVVGAQRERVRALLAAGGLDCEVCELAWQSLERADEAFLTNSVIGIWPIVRWGERRYAVGPVTRGLQAALEQADARA